MICAPESGIERSTALRSRPAGNGFLRRVLACALAGRIPARGELVRHPSGIEFEVLDADPRRIKKLGIHMPQERKDAPAPESS